MDEPESSVSAWLAVLPRAKTFRGILIRISAISRSWQASTARDGGFLFPAGWHRTVFVM